MAHPRNRFIAEQIKKQASLWPVVGLFGLRQSGKTTLMCDQLSISNYVTLDDDALNQSLAAPKVFLARQSLPTIVDEVTNVE